MDEQPQEKEGDTGSKEGTLNAIMAANPQFQRYLPHNTNSKRKNFFSFSKDGSNGLHFIFYVNCNTLIMSSYSPANGKPANATIESYVFDAKNDIYPIFKTDMGIREGFFRKMRDVAEGRDFSHCSYLAQNPQGELEVKVNGRSCVLPSSYEGKSVSELFVLREQLLAAKNYLRRKAENIKMTQEQKKEIHLALLVLESNIGELNKIYMNPRTSGGWVQSF